MDMVIRIHNRYIRLSHSRQREMEELGAQGPITTVRGDHGYYCYDPDGFQVMDVTGPWNVATDKDQLKP